MRVYLRVIILLSIPLFLPFSANAGGVEKRCHALYSKLNLQVRSKFLSPDEEGRILSIARDHVINPKIRAKAVFDLLFEARLRMLPTGEANEARRILRETTLTASKGDLDGAYLAKSNSLELAIPELLQETAVHYFVLFHELEHSAQFNNMAAKLTRNTGELSPFSMSVIDRYFLEDGAMRAEWQYLRQIPKSDRDNLIELIKGDAQLSPHQKEWLAASLGNAELSQKAYLEKIRSLRSYSKEALVWEIARKPNLLLFLGLPGMAIPPVGLIMFFQYCKNIRAKGYVPVGSVCY